MKSRTILLLCFLAFRQDLAAQSSFTLGIRTDNSSGRLSLSAQPAAKPTLFSGSLTETLDQVFDSITALTPVKGFNAALLLPDGSLWKRARGLAAEAPAALPLTTDYLMGMGSISKSFVATTLLLLYEDGLIDLGDSIGKYVGPYPNVPGNVTIRQLLGQRSGINDYLNENPATGQAWVEHPDSIWAADTILNHYVLAPNFPVDSAWSYSNTNYLLAGRILESVTGQPWYQVVRQRLLAPQGLTHTFAYPWETPGSQPFSHVWIDLDGNGTVEDAQGLGLPVEGLFSLGSSAGCLITTPEDLVRFSQRVYGGQVLQPATLAEMQTDYIQDASNGLYGLGTASFLLPQGIENWGHNGDLVYKAFALYFPSENMALAVQQNDDRSFDPVEPAPVFDLYVVYLALLDAYLNYSPASATQEAGQGVDPLTAIPNPAGTSFRLRCPENGRVAFPLRLVLTDLAGRVALEEVVNNPAAEVQVGQLPPGLYLLRAGACSGKLVKE